MEKAFAVLRSEVRGRHSAPVHAACILFRASGPLLPRDS